MAGAVVGGILTGVAGYLGILYVRGKDKADEHTRFLGAVRIVLDELGANQTNLEALVGQAFGKLEVYDASFRSVELLLANYMGTTIGGWSPRPMHQREHSGCQKTRPHRPATASAFRASG